jgi:hypothetical protein
MDQKIQASNHNIASTRASLPSLNNKIQLLGHTSHHSKVFCVLLLFAYPGKLLYHGFAVQREFTS